MPKNNDKKGNIRKNKNLKLYVAAVSKFYAQHCVGNTALLVFNGRRINAFEAYNTFTIAQRPPDCDLTCDFLGW